METLEDNRLIAEFMDFEILDLDSDFPYVDIYPPQREERLPMLEHYFSDWNELMPVVEKIEGIECQKTSTEIIRYHLYDVEIRQNVCTIHGTDIEESFSDKIDNVYFAVVEFIKRYNN